MPRIAGTPKPGIKSDDEDEDGEPDDAKSPVAQALVQLTDLGLAWKIIDGEARVFAFSCLTGQPLAGVTLATYGVGPVEGIAHEIEQELGIDVTVELWPFDDHAALVDRDPPHLWTMAWSADYPHPHDVLGLLLRSGSSANDGRWSDTRFDALIDAAAATDDAAEQARLYSEAGSIVGEEAPIIPLGYGSSWALSREGLLGAGISGVGLMRFADLAWDE